MDTFKENLARFLTWVDEESHRIAEHWRTHSNRRSMGIIIAGGLAALVAYVFVIAPPQEFPTGELISVPEGASAADVSRALEEQGVVQEALALQIAVQILGRDRGVRAGDYLFKEPTNILSVARRITTGAFGLEPIRIRVAEGMTTRDMAKIFGAQLQRFDEEKFLAKAQPQEGFLFPDTYFFLPNANEDIVIDALRQNFDARIQELMGDITKSGRPLNEIVIMASILEKEGIQYEERRRIAGVLWRRIKINMALQVDAAFLYSIGRATFTLTNADLQNKNDPYNTYVHKGLPPGAIGSPSLSSLRAAANPIDEGYLFYLADRNHNTYFSKTYEEHLEKKALYIGT
ncbi:MAG: endolytic transglycosylase MltG [Minisyncoccia bacterium]